MNNKSYDSIPYLPGESSPPPEGFFYGPSGRLIKTVTQEEIDQVFKREKIEETFDPLPDFMY